jgi:mRNA interferase RelE/StbE
MGYRVEILRSAAQELKHLPQPTRRRVMRAIHALANDPRPPGAKLLTGPERFWRVRVGDYRVVYRTTHELVEVLVLRVRHRSDADP